MARVLGVHEIELKPGTDPAEFEQAVAQALTRPIMTGWRARVLKGDRGPRAGHYLMVFEIDSVEARDRFFPAEEQADQEENDRFAQENPDAASAWGRVFAMIIDPNAGTDYLELG